MLQIKIIRKAISHHYKRDPSAQADWHNNDANNSLDTFQVLKDELPIAIYNAQTVSNLEGLDEGVKYTSTIASGKFYIRAFVPGRQHYGRIHGIVYATTLAGDKINGSSITNKDPARWLVHDWEKLNSTSPAGVDTRVAWSAGCIVLKDADLIALGKVFDDNGIKQGDLIPAELIEV